jgi:hypothetical protein
MKGNFSVKTLASVLMFFEPVVVMVVARIFLSKKFD